MKSVMSENDMQWIHRYLFNKGLISEETAVFRYLEDIDRALYELGDSRRAEKLIQSMWNAFRQHKRRSDMKQKKGVSSCTFELSEASKTMLKSLTEWNEQSQNRVIGSLIEKEYNRLFKTRQKQAKSLNINEPKASREASYLEKALAGM